MIAPLIGLCAALLAAMWCLVLAERRLPVESAVVIFDARCPGRDDRMLLGVGDQPMRWPRGEFHEGSARRARTHV